VVQEAFGVNAHVLDVCARLRRGLRRARARDLSPQGAGLAVPYETPAPAMAELRS
jgi:hypothetical protein